MNPETASPVLLVEDEHLIALSLKMALVRFGHQIMHAATGSEAVSCAGTIGAEAVVLMDVDLGHGMDGIAAAHAISDRHGLPVVFLTAHSDDEHLIRSAHLPSYGQVSKTAGYAQIDHAIRKARLIHAAKANHHDNLKHYRELLADEHHAVIRTDHEGRCVEANERFLELAGLCRDDAIGLHYEDFLPPGRHGELLGSHGRTPAPRGWSASIRHHYPGREGHLMPADVHLFTVADADSHHGVCSVIRPLS